jgi:hypothetical protein
MRWKRFGIVAAVVAGISCPVILALIYFMYSNGGPLDDSHRNLTRLKMNHIRDTMLQYEKICGHLPYPSAESTVPIETTGAQCDGKLLPQTAVLTNKYFLTDHWNEMFIYKEENGELVLLSLGLDKKAGGDGDAADIILDVKDE